MLNEILRALSSYIFQPEETNNLITMQDFILLGLSGNNNATILRNKISKKLNLGYGNAKAILKRINMLNISLEKLKEVINDCK